MPTALCQTHGLRYDPESVIGCIRCRAEVAAAKPSTTRRALLAASVAGVALAAAGATMRRLTGEAVPAVLPVPAVGEVDAPVAIPAGGHVSIGELSAIRFGIHSGALFEPAAVPASLPSPLILLFDPAGNARDIVHRYSRAASAHGWLAASCSEVMNGSPEVADTDAMMDLLAFVRARREIDSSRVFAGGMSGGACGAYRLALERSDAVHGAIVECGHMGPWRDVGGRATSALRFYLFTREHDFNRPATLALRDAMTAAGCRVTESEAPGGHMPMGEKELEVAVSWMAA